MSLHPEQQISPPKRNPFGLKSGSVISSIAEAAEPDVASMLRTSIMSSSSSTFSQSVRNGLHSLKKNSMGMFGGGLKLRKFGRDDLLESVDDVLANRYARTSQIGYVAILKKIEKDFLADMTHFTSLIREHCEESSNIRTLLDIIASMQQTSGVISETPSNIKSEWPWKDTTSSYIRLVALIKELQKLEDPLFRAKSSGLRLDLGLLQKFNGYLYKILARPVWLRFFLHVTCMALPYEDRENLEFAMSQVRALVVAALELSGIDENADGFNEMVELEREVDATQCMFLDVDNLKHRFCSVKLFLSVPSHASASCVPRAPLPLPPKPRAVYECREIFLETGKRRGGRATLTGAILSIRCFDDFILVGRNVEVHLVGTVFKLLYIPVTLDKVSAKRFDSYASIENVIEINLGNAVLIPVQSVVQDEGSRIYTYLNSFAQNGQNKRFVVQSIWLVDKPSNEDIPAPVPACPEPLSIPAEPNTKVFDCMCYPFIKKDGDWHKLAKCFFYIYTAADGSRPFISISLESTKANIARADIRVDLTVKATEERTFCVNLQVKATGAISCYSIKVKDKARRDEILSIIDGIKANLAASNCSAVIHNLVVQSIPDFIRLCPYLTPRTLWFDCIVNVRSACNGEAGARLQQLGYGKMCLKTLESPMGTFKIVTVSSKPDPNRIYLESLVTSDMLVQDCRTQSCSLIKVLFASKSGIEYQFEMIARTPALGEGARPAVLEPLVSQLIVSFFSQHVPTHESVFGSDVISASPSIIRSSSFDVAETRANLRCPSPSKLSRTFQSSRNLTVSKKGNNSSITGSQTKVAGWVASQVRFFNNLSQRGNGDIVDQKTAVKRRLYANVFDKSTHTLKDTLNTAIMRQTFSTSDLVPDESDKRSKDVTSNEMEDEEKSVILPPSGCPQEVLACWMFIPRSAKKIIVSGGAIFDMKYFVTAVEYLELNAAAINKNFF